MGVAPAGMVAGRAGEGPAMIAPLPPPNLLGVGSFGKDGGFVKTQSLSLLADYAGPPLRMSTMARIRGILRRNDDQFGRRYRIVHATVGCDILAPGSTNRQHQ